jgi:hypothetical protein
MEIIIRTVDDIYREKNPPCKSATLKRVIYPKNKHDVERIPVLTIYDGYLE